MITLIYSCGKREELNEVVKCKVVQKPSGGGVAFAKVHLEDNIFTDDGAYYQTNKVIYADEHGEFEVLRSEGHEFVRAEVDGFFTGARSREPISNSNEITIELTGKAWMRLHVHNVGDAADDDVVRVWPRFLNQSPMPHLFEGADVDTELFGMIRANEQWRIRWMEIHHQQEYWHTFETSAGVGDTIHISVAY